MNKFFTMSMALSMGLALCACDAGPEDIQDESSEGADARIGNNSGGYRFNTNKVGDKAFAALHGYYKEYRDNQLHGVTLHVKELEVKCERVWAEKSELHCRDFEGQIWSNWAFEGSVWKLNLRGDDEALVIGDMTHDGNVWLYRFNDFASGPDKVPACDEDVDNPGNFWSVALNDLDLNEDGKVFEEKDLVYLACTSGSTGKTVERMGITPWDHGLAQYNAGVYMTMLAPCGDRNSMTEPGTPLRLYDMYGINNFGPGIPNTSEGVWGPEGMVCSGKKLRTNVLVTDPIECPGGYKIPICSDHELKDILVSEPDVNLWTKPKA